MAAASAERQRGQPRHGVDNRRAGGLVSGGPVGLVPARSPLVEMPPPTPQRALLLPLAGLYAAATRWRLRLYNAGRLERAKLTRPVISVGNLSLGGSGKTPCVLAIARWLRTRGLRPAVLSRGYGRRSRGVVVVSDGERVRASVGEAGDEPLLLARELGPGAIVVVAERRFLAGLAAERLGAQVHILDDGFQHLQLERDYDLLLMEASVSAAELQVVPVGRLREPLSAMSRADAVLVTRSHRAHDAGWLSALLAAHGGDTPVYVSSRRVCGWRLPDGELLEPSALSGRRALVLAGIARPAQFVEDVEALGVSVAAQLLYRDHHAYGARDIERVRAALRSHRAELVVTTAKDAVKLESLAPSDLERVSLIEETLLPEDPGWCRRLEDLCRQASAP